VSTRRLSPNPVTHTVSTRCLSPNPVTQCPHGACPQTQSHSVHTAPVPKPSHTHGVLTAPVPKPSHTVSTQHLSPNPVTHTRPRSEEWHTESEPLPAPLGLRPGQQGHCLDSEALGINTTRSAVLARVEKERHGAKWQHQLGEGRSGAAAARLTFSSPLN
jgi:hypothetical protein